MDPVVLGELFTAIQHDPGLTPEQRDAAQQTLLFNYSAPASWAFARRHGGGPRGLTPPGSSLPWPNLTNEAKETIMLLRPLNDRLIVRRAAEAEMTPGGLFIPDPAKEKPIQGTVVSVGPGKVLDGAVVPLDIQTGDTVLFGKYAGTEVLVDREEFLILREDDVLAVVQPEDSALDTSAPTP